MFGERQRLRKVIQILKTMLMRLVNRKCWPLCLLVEIDKASRTRLKYSLVISVHRIVDPAIDLQSLKFALSSGLLALDI